MSLAKLRNKLGEGARADKYKITINRLGDSDGTVDILCSASSLPSKTIGVAEVWSQGRKLPLAGDEAFENTWEVTFWNDVNMEMRDAVDTWMKAIDSVITNVSDEPNVATYAIDATVQQLNRNMEPIMTYTFYDLFPITLGEVELGDDQVDTVNQSSVTFSFSYWEQQTGGSLSAPVAPNPGNAI